jgi:hypothetical protein
VPDAVCGGNRGSPGEGDAPSSEYGEADHDKHGSERQPHPRDDAGDPAQTIAQGQADDGEDADEPRRHQESGAEAVRYPVRNSRGSCGAAAEVVGEERRQHREAARVECGERARHEGDRYRDSIHHQLACRRSVNGHRRSRLCPDRRSAPSRGCTMVNRPWAVCSRRRSAARSRSASDARSEGPGVTSFLRVGGLGVVPAIELHAWAARSHPPARGSCATGWLMPGQPGGGCRPRRRDLWSGDQANSSRRTAARTRE